MENESIRENVLENSIPLNVDNIVSHFFVEKQNLVGSSEKEKFTEAKEHAYNFLVREQDTFYRFDNSFEIFLKNFVENQKRKEEQKLNFKRCFFYPLTVVFLIILLMPIVIVYLFKDLFTEIGAIVSVLSALVELTAAIIILPKIIVMYLFNKQEDEKLLDIIQNMQEYNQKKHEHIIKFSDMSNKEA